jgi:DNA-binding transcriptional LysR family regulator
MAVNSNKVIETGQLQTLVVVAEERSFSKAAERLHVTQSAISQSIKSFENRIGAKLFRRHGKSVSLTPEGHKLFALGTQFLSQLDNILQEIRFNKNDMRGPVRIGTLTGLGKSWLAAELLEFAKNNPDINIDIKLGFQTDLVKDFEQSLLDFLILPEYDLPATGKKVLLSEEKTTLVFPKHSDFPLNDQMSLDELSQYPTILFEKGDLLYERWCTGIFKRVPKDINVRYIINSHGNMLQAVSQGIGVAVIPTHVLKRSFYKDKVLNLGDDFEVSNGKFYLVYNEYSEDVVRLQAVLKRLVDSKNTLSSGLWS